MKRTHEDFAHLKADALVRGDFLPIGFKQFIHAAADVAAAQKTDGNLFHSFVLPFHGNIGAFSPVPGRIRRLPDSIYPMFRS